MARTDDFFQPENLVDPHGFYKVMRSDRPVFQTVLPGQGLDVFVVMSYDLVRQVLDDNNLFSSDVAPIMLGASRQGDAELVLDNGTGGAPLLLNMDEPAHGRYRALFNPMFSPRQANRLAPKISEIMDRLIDSVIEQGRCDFIDDIAVPFTLYVICDMMGFDRSHYAKMKRWTDAIVRLGGQQEVSESYIATMREIAEFHDFIAAELEARRDAPRDDLLSEILAARIDGQAPLSDRELLMSIQELCVAGNETSRNTLVGGLALLLNAPATLEALRSDSKLIPAAVEELLRLFSPVTGTWRLATRDTILGGVNIPAGAPVMVRMEAANRDPAQFPDPDAIDLTRRNRNMHLSFSHGVHYCIGNMIARRELAIALEKILARFQDLKLVEAESDLRRPPSVMLRGNNAMIIAFAAGQPVLT